jgi:hypothetical protein
MSRCVGYKLKIECQFCVCHFCGPVKSTSYWHSLARAKAAINKKIAPMRSKCYKSFRWRITNVKYEDIGKDTNPDYDEMGFVDF